MKTDTSPEPLLATARSVRPSPLKSAAATPTGPVPVARLGPARKTGPSEAFAGRADHGKSASDADNRARREIRDIEGIPFGQARRPVE